LVKILVLPLYSEQLSRELIPLDVSGRSDMRRSLLHMVVESRETECELSMRCTLQVDQFGLRLDTPTLSKGIMQV
jgi:hypothetical protein